MTSKEVLEKELQEQMTYIERNGVYYEVPEWVKKDLDRLNLIEKGLKDLFQNHIDFVCEKDRCYFIIKNSKGKEKSFTSKTFEDFWKGLVKNENTNLG